MRTFRYLLAGLGVMALASAASADERTLAPARLSNLEVSGGIHLEASAGPVRSITLSGDETSLARTRIRQTKDGVEIERSCLFGCDSRRNRVTVKVVSPELSTLALAQGVEASVSGVSASTFTIAATQGVDLTITGQCQSLILKGSMGVAIDASDLRCATAQVKSSMGADLDFFASEKAEVSATMGASVRARGGAKTFDANASMGGSIERD